MGWCYWLLPRCGRSRVWTPVPTHFPPPTFLPPYHTFPNTACVVGPGFEPPVPTHFPPPPFLPPYHTFPNTACVVGPGFEPPVPTHFPPPPFLPPYYTFPNTACVGLQFILCLSQGCMTTDAQWAFPFKIHTPPWANCSWIFHRGVKVSNVTTVDRGFFGNSRTTLAAKNNKICRCGMGKRLTSVLEFWYGYNPLSF